ncbi:uncharacterized protein LOC109610686 isoform X2 [Ooceraea biroi]|uniref:uncharacterized protein LOC109610686 isoform X2 n=1 Tax=Ooceraea biroi TaxID=2015173 RepID=UPI0009716AF1|nr:uncharacterized protein LOC109610686 isoform X2 [Ooceraea biroi]
MHTRTQHCIIRTDCYVPDVCHVGLTRTRWEEDVGTLPGGDLPGMTTYRPTDRQVSVCESSALRTTVLEVDVLVRSWSSSDVPFFA